MTAYPNQDVFRTTVHSVSKPVFVLYPNLREHFWGYEVTPHEFIFDAVLVRRIFAAAVAVASGTAALTLWVGPNALVQGNFGAAIVLSALLIVVTLLATRIARAGTQVRVQIDTRIGEIRQVVDQVLGSPRTLRLYGIDAVDKIEVARSDRDPSEGQILLFMNDGSVVPVGDGDVDALVGLKRRIASDCGLRTARSAVTPDMPLRAARATA